MEKSISEPPGHSETHSVNRGQYLADSIYGANDGIITTFAVVAGSAGAGLSSSIVIMLGLANLFADAISMGLSSYLSLRSKKSFELRERAREVREIQTVPGEERREVEDIIRGWGVDESRVGPVTDDIIKDKKRWVDFMMKEELGINESAGQHPFSHGAVTFAAFMIAGSMPLIPYLFGVPVESQFVVSIVATALSLFIVGSLRSTVTKQGWLIAGLEMLGVGGLAAFAAYGIGALAKNIIGA